VWLGLTVGASAQDWRPAVRHDETRYLSFDQRNVAAQQTARARPYLLAQGLKQIRAALKR
jgi:hypothetical protein